MIKFGKMNKFILTIFLLLFVSCSKRETDCRLYTKGDLKLERSGECYYLKQGKKVYLDKEDCANYCD